MFCTKCGKELENNMAFCIYCGNKLEASAESFQPTESTTNSSQMNYDDAQGISNNDFVQSNASEEPRRRHGKIFISMIVVVAVIVVGSVVGSKMYNSPRAQMNRAITAGDIELAYEIFEDNFYAEDLTEKSIELLQAAATQVQEDYIAGTITYSEANEILWYIKQFGSDEVNETVTNVSASIESQYQIATQLESAEAYYQDGEFYSAITVYENVLSLDSSNADAISGITKAEDAWRSAVLADAESYASQGDFDGAAEVIYTAETQYFGEDAELSAALDSFYEREIEQMTEEVYAAADGGDWDGAIELLDTYQTKYPNDQTLEDARADIIDKMPITLKNLTMVSSDQVTVITSVVSDRWGNVYDGAVNYDASRDAFGLYNLNKGYSSFSGIVCISTEATNGKDISFAVYLDEVLVYYQDGITEETAPISFEIDTTGATTMRIVTNNDGSYSCGYLYFVNTSFEKQTE